MKLQVVDYRKKLMMTFKVEITRNMFIVVPQAVDKRFEYLENRLRSLRTKFMVTYLCYQENDKTERGAKELELDIYETVKEELQKEFKQLFIDEGSMYYIVEME